MQKINEIKNCIIATAIGYKDQCYVIDIPSEYTHIITDGYFGEDDITTINIPNIPGVYRCDIEFWFEQGYSDGFKADGESDFEYRLVNIKKVNLDVQ